MNAIHQMLQIGIWIKKKQQQNYSKDEKKTRQNTEGYVFSLLQRPKVLNDRVGAGIVTNRFDAQDRHLNLEKQQQNYSKEN